MEDARDGQGRFFPLPKALRDAVREHPVSARTVLGTLFTALLHHTVSTPADDTALLVLRNDRNPARCTAAGARDGAVCGSAARGRPAPDDAQPTTRR